MSDNLLIVFVKNAIPGKVKTRLAKTIGHQDALKVYFLLLKITEAAISEIQIDKRIYYSESKDTPVFDNTSDFIQQGEDLGDKMRNAFQDGIRDGYQNIVLIGSDLPQISANIIRQGFSVLDDYDCVFGPAKDGGYYLIGLKSMQSFIFESKPWSQSNLLDETLKEVASRDLSVFKLPMLNDIDNINDLKEFPQIMNDIGFGDEKVKNERFGQAEK